MDAGIDHLPERLTRRLQLREGLVVGEQVGVFGHQVGLGEFDRGLRTALRSWVGRFTGVHRDPVMASEPDDLRVADRDPRDMVEGDSFLVVSQQIRRCPTEAAQRHVQRGEHTRCGLVPQRQHHPEP
jgi:hypothetical protein